MASRSEIYRTLNDILAINIKGQVGTRRLLDKLIEFMDFSGYQIIEQVASFSDMDHTNLIGINGPPGPGGLLLCTTIESAGCTDASRWTSTEEDPFNPTQRDGLIHAHGAASGKVDLVCKMLALSHIEPSLVKRPLIMATMVGAQARVRGPMQLLDSGVCQPQWALVSEPTSLELVTAHRGYLALRFHMPAASKMTAPKDGQTYRVHCRGESAHSTTPYLGRNAVLLSLMHIEGHRRDGRTFTVHNLHGGQQMDEVPEQCTFFIHVPAGSDWMPTGSYLEVEPVTTPQGLCSDVSPALERWNRLFPKLHELFRWSTPEGASEFYPSTPLYNVSGISNTADGQTSITLDFRPLPGQRAEDLVQDIQVLLRQESTQSHDALVSVTVEQHLIPMEGDDNSMLAQEAKKVLRDVGVPPVISTYAGSSEGWIFNASGIDTVVFGPGVSMGVARRPNEYTIGQHVEKAVLFYEKLTRRLCCDDPTEATG
jgi:acetylornithine deacetylase/succinyl-diaminopimelate desuccinylase-like protein